MGVKKGMILLVVVLGLSGCGLKTEVKTSMDSGLDNVEIDYYEKLIEAARECILQSRDGKTSETY